MMPLFYMKPHTFLGLSDLNGKCGDLVDIMPEYYIILSQNNNSPWSTAVRAGQVTCRTLGRFSTEQTLTSSALSYKLLFWTESNVRMFALEISGANSLRHSSCINLCGISHSHTLCYNMLCSCSFCRVLLFS